MTTPTMTLVEAIATRRSVRGFLPDPVSDDVLQEIFELARTAPSNCNTQPWTCYVASGDLKNRLRDQFLQRQEDGVPGTPDFGYVSKFEGEYRKRQVECAVALYDEMGISRDDKAGRLRAVRRNFEFFDAPYILFLGMDRKFSSTIALDVGIYAQTLMLAMTAYGVSTCAMGSMRAYPDLVREAFRLDEQTGILLGISFGYEDPEVPANRTRTTREPLSDTVIFKNQ
ncbi:nitroreductase [Marinobacter salicampi]|uniref:nitroreductase n=1 Tax=Marinobacter salicampi TaxID=435907 RepID=UPI001407BD0B|nr:nitroreductase [Marinobacter salicampi]